LNFFYQMLNLVNRLFIVLVEISVGRETLDLGSIESVSDTGIYLRHRVKIGFSYKYLKSRSFVKYL